MVFGSIVYDAAIGSEVFLRVVGWQQMSEQEKVKDEMTIFTCNTMHL